jgi:hypothetical protein
LLRRLLLPHLHVSVPFALSRSESFSKTRDVCECSERYLESDSSQDFNQFNLIEVWMVSECGWCTQRALGFRVHAARSEEPRSHERCKLPALCVWHVYFARWICLLHHHLLNIIFEFCVHTTTDTHTHTRTHTCTYVKYICIHQYIYMIY